MDGRTAAVLRVTVCGHVEEKKKMKERRRWHGQGSAPVDLLLTLLVRFHAGLPVKKEIRFTPLLNCNRHYFGCVMLSLCNTGGDVGTSGFNKERRSENDTSCSGGKEI